MDMRKETIQQENKKALKPFLLILIAAVILGGALGIWISLMKETETGLAIEDALYAFLGTVSPWMVFVATAVCRPFAANYYSKAKRSLDDWDGEDDNVYDQVEHDLSVGLIINTANQILVFLFFGVAGVLMYNPITVLLSVLGMLLALVLCVRYQRRTVDLLRELNPEKDGSVYDVKFQKKWLASCDEAERAQIGEAAYHSFRLMNSYAYPLLWLVAVLGGMTFDWGAVPVVMISILWMIQVMTYNWKALQLQKGKKKGA
jgi:hypothetical protein